MAFVNFVTPVPLLEQKSAVGYTAKEVKGIWVYNNPGPTSLLSDTQLNLQKLGG